MSFSQLPHLGLGLRHEFARALADTQTDSIDFLELTPENWMEVGGLRRAMLSKLAKQYPIIAHGLSLSIGSPAPLNWDLIAKLSEFFHQYNIACYSEHLSFCSDDKGYLHDLLPIPFTVEAANYVGDRIKKVQAKLSMLIAFENASYYYPPGQSISELEFIRQILEASDCLMLLDVNNVYVNSVNHGYCPYKFIEGIPSEKIAYLHIAGHWKESETLLIDTHGTAVIDPVWKLLLFTYQTHGLKPTVLERDSDIPPLETLMQEIKQIRAHQQSVEC